MESVGEQLGKGRLSCPRPAGNDHTFRPCTHNCKRPPDSNLEFIDFGYARKLAWQMNASRGGKDRDLIAGKLHVSLVNARGA